MPLAVHARIRLLAKLDKVSSPHGCWLWTGCTHNPSGKQRGVIYVDGHYIESHKAASDSKPGALETSKMKVTVTQLKTSIPEWYTIEYLEANNITPEQGAQIKSKVSVTSKKISAQLHAEEQRLAEKYPGTQLFV